MRNSSFWPAVGRAPREWTPAPAFTYTSARRLQEQTGPYEVAVVPPIADLTPTLDAGLVGRADEATRAITAFDVGVGSRLTPYTSILLRSESAASSRIENLTASARAVAEAEFTGKPRENTPNDPLTILGNVRAMQAALAASDRLDVAAVLEMHAALMADTWPQIAGHLRTQQVWIGGSDLGPRHAMFVPPDPADVPAAMTDLVAFAARTDLPPLIQAAVTHAHFETVHPFADGNGRTGRALLHAQLRHTGVATHVTVPISTGLLVRKDAYFAALTAYRAGDIAPIVDSVAQAAHEAVETGTGLVGRLEEVRTGWAERLRARDDSAVWPLLDLLIRRPVLDAPTAAAELGVSAVTARNRFAELVAADIVRESTGRRRGRVWRAPAVLDALDAYAEGVGRRAP